jgi:hypothetical protein
VSYCRTGGGIGNTYMICTNLDPATLTWGADISSPVDWTYPDVFG